MVNASCHCGAVQWTAPEPTELHVCNCSFCARSGAIWTTAPIDAFELKTMPERVSAYQFGSYTVKHYHCNVCGLPLYIWSPEFGEDGTPDFEKPQMIWNVRMAPECDPSNLPVHQIDGKTF